LLELFKDNRPLLDNITADQTYFFILRLKSRDEDMERKSRYPFLLFSHESEFLF